MGAQGGDFILREQGVVLDLVDGGWDGGVGEEVGEVRGAVVADADRADFPRGEQGLH